MFKLTNLTKKYAGKTILSDVNYQFPNQGLVCLLGDSGVGKSTLINILAGLDTDYEGSVMIGGYLLKEQTADQLANYRKDTIGFVFQEYQLLEGYSALENVCYPMSLQPMDSKEVTAQALDYLKKMGLEAQAHQKIETLSGGQKQRVAIARAQMNQPRVILADEPTGALDAKNTEEVMKRLKNIAQNCLVIMITHDVQLCQYADEVITIADKKIVVQKALGNHREVSDTRLTLREYSKVSMFPLALKQFRVTFKYYLLIASMIAIGGICILLTLSSNQMMADSVTAFQEKNEVLRNGSIRTKSPEIDYELLLKELKEDDRLEYVFAQKVLENVELTLADQTIVLPEKFPLAKSEETFSYGIMPRTGKKEIALSGTLAKQFTEQINTLIGKEITLKVEDQPITLTISGIYNTSYDDFYISADQEYNLYSKGVKGTEMYAIHFDVKEITDVATISEMLEQKKVNHQMSVTQVTTMLQSFTKIKTLFLMISGLVMSVCLLLTVILFGKLQASRKKMIGLLETFGFNQKLRRRLLWNETILLASLTGGLLGVFYVILLQLMHLFNWQLSIEGTTFFGLLVLTFIVVIGIGGVINDRTFKKPTVQLLKG